MDLLRGVFYTSRGQNILVYFARGAKYRRGAKYTVTPDSSVLVISILKRVINRKLEKREEIQNKKNKNEMNNNSGCAVIVKIRPNTIPPKIHRPKQQFQHKHFLFI